jgi:hypothetical protein
MRARRKPASPWRSRSGAPTITPQKAGLVTRRDGGLVLPSWSKLARHVRAKAAEGSRVMETTVHGDGSPACQARSSTKE